MNLRPCVQVLATLATLVVAHGHLRGLDATLAASDNGQPAIEWWHGRAWQVPASYQGQPLSRRLLSGQRVISGIANTLMEDHFDTSEHFASTIVDTMDGERFRVSLPFHEKFMNEPVRWIVDESSNSNPFDMPNALGDNFSSG